MTEPLDLDALRAAWAADYAEQDRRIGELQDDLDAARAEVARLRAVVASVEALHVHVPPIGRGSDTTGWCRRCHTDWPCEHRRLTAAQDAPAPTPTEEAAT